VLPGRNHLRLSGSYDSQARTRHADLNEIDKNQLRLAAEADVTVLGGKEAAETEEWTFVNRLILFLQSVVARKLGIYWTAASSKR
jgi:hypothetical protein